MAAWLRQALVRRQCWGECHSDFYWRVFRFRQTCILGLLVCAAHNVFFHCLLRRSCGLWRGDVQSMMAFGAYRSQHSLVLAWSFAVQETLAEYKLVHPYAMWAHFWCVVLQLSW